MAIIKNLEKIQTDESNQIFHAGTSEKNKKIFSKGGRVLNITTSGKKLINARDKSLSILKKIDWKEGFFRSDIGWRTIERYEDN